MYVLRGNQRAQASACVCHDRVSELLPMSNVLMLCLRIVQGQVNSEQC